MKVKIYKNPINRFVWFWELSLGGTTIIDVAFTRKGAVRAARRELKKYNMDTREHYVELQ